LRAFLENIFGHAIAAVRPDAMPLPFPPAPKGRLIVVGAGKVAAAMAVATERHYGDKAKGLVIVPDGYDLPTAHIVVVQASHPLPDARGTAAAARILQMAEDAQAGDLVLCLLSGGASALMALPAPGVSLADKRAATAALLRSGAAIGEINCVRKHLSAIKGGRLAAAAAPAHVASLIVSDVVGDDPAVIASGPTVSDPTTCAQALSILERYGVAVPENIVAALKDGRLETPSVLPHGEVHVVARPSDAFVAAKNALAAEGFAIVDLGDRREGEAQAEAAHQAALVRDIRAGKGAVHAPCAIVSGGELVVTLSGEGRGEGRGGPNTEFALALALALDGVPDVWALAADTDGCDGNAGAAGAVIDPSTLTRARGVGLDAAMALGAHDSATFFADIGGLLNPGPTYTNVNDFRVILVGAALRG